MSFEFALLQDMLFFLVLGAVAAYLAIRRGRSPIVWGLLGMLVLPLIVLLFLPKKPKDGITGVPNGGA